MLEMMLLTQYIHQICIGNTHNLFTIPFHASIACNKFIVYNETIIFVGSHKKIELDEFCLPSIRQILIFCPLSLLSSLYKYFSFCPSFNRKTTSLSITHKDLDLDWCNTT